MGTGLGANSAVGFTVAGVTVRSACSTDPNGTFPSPPGTGCTFAIPAVPGGNETIDAWGATNTTGIGVGTNPYGIAFDSAKGEMFVADSFTSDNVTVISDSTDAVLTTVAVGSDPTGVAYDSGTGEIYVANGNSNNVSVISDTNNTVVASVAVGNVPVGVTYDSGLGEVFVANQFDNTVSVISDTNHSVVATVAVGTFPYYDVYDSGTGQVFVPNSGTDNVSVISDLTNAVVATVPLSTGSVPIGLAYEPTGGAIVVADYGLNEVSVISDTTDAVVVTVGVGNSPEAVAYDSGQGRMIVANNVGNNVSIIAVGNDTVVGNIPVGTGPQAAVYDTGTGQVFVTNFYSNNVTVLSTAHASAVFTVDPGLALATGSGGADLGQTVTADGNGFGSSLSISSFTLGSYSISCIGATTGSCLGGAITADAAGSFGAQFVVPAAAAAGRYMATATDSAGNVANSTVVLYSDPAVGTPTATPSSVDLGQAASFGAVASFGSGKYSYAWAGLPAGCTGTLAMVACAPTSVGNFSVSVNVTDSNGVSVVSGNTTFTSYADPVTALPTASRWSGHVDAGQTVTFAAPATLGTGTYSSYVWTGLPTGCQGSTVVVTCSGVDLPAGSYSVSVAVTDSNNYTSGASQGLPFVVIPAPTVTTPAPTRTSADVGQGVEFTSTAGGGSGSYQYSWAGLPLGCSGGSSNATVSCTLSGVGTFAISLQVTDSNGATVISGSLLFIAYSDPSVSLGANRTAFDAGQPVTITAAGTQGSGGLDFRWTGLPGGCRGRNASLVCTPSRPGNFSVGVNVADSNSATAQSPPLELEVAPTLAANISASTSSPKTGESVGFASNVSGGTGAIAYAWAFGDGTRGSGVTADHAYRAAGTFAVSLWANDSSGASVHEALNLTVSDSGTILGVPPAEFAVFVVAIFVAAVVVAAVVLRVRGRRRKGSAPAEPGQGTTVDESAP